MKSERTIQNEIKKLRQFIDGPGEDETIRIAKRVAWSVEQALRTTIETVKDWPTLTEDCMGTARLILQETKGRTL